MYELTNEWNGIYARLQDADANLDETLADCKQVEGKITEKADAYGKIIRMMQGDVDAQKAEASRLSARAKATENRIAALKAQLCETMKAMGKDKLRTSFFTFSVSPTPPAVKITDLEAALNAGYIKEPSYDESCLDKAAMKRDLEAGLTIPGAELTRGETLRMR